MTSQRKILVRNFLYGAFNMLSTKTKKKPNVWRIIVNLTKLCLVTVIPNIYSLRSGLIEIIDHFTRIKKKYK